MSTKRLSSIIVALIMALPITAGPYCDIRKFSILDGLAANNITDLQQGADNLMWFATWNGLSYYDGYGFHTFRDNPDDIDLLSTNRIVSISPCRNNDVWCLTFDRKPYVYDTRLCSFVNVGKQLNEQFGIDLRVQSIYSKQSRNTWLTSVDKKYLVRMSSPDINELTTEVIRPGQKGLRSGNVWIVRGDKKGREWILTDKGTCIYGTKFSTPIPFMWIREVGNTVFLATTDGRLAVYDEHNHLSMIPLPKGVTRINELKNTGYQLLIATNIGVIVYNPRNFKTDVISVQNPNQPSPEVRKIYVDHYNMVWAFTEGQGVTIINPKTMQQQWLYADVDNPEDRTTSSHFFIMEDEHNTLWIVPNYGTFSYYDRKAGKLVPYVLKSNSSGNSHVPRITKYIVSDQGILWVTGIHDLTQINFKYHTYTLNSLEQGESEVRSIMLTANGCHWDGYFNGVIKVSDSHHNKLGYLAPNGQLVPQQIPFANTGIYSLFQDSRGRVWIGTNSQGIYVLDGAKVTHYGHQPHDRFSLPSDTVYDMVTDKHGRIWIATYGGGLATVDETGGQMRFISKYSGLSYPKDMCQKTRRINCTPTGEILVGTTDGLISFSDNYRKLSDIRFYRSYHLENDTLSPMTSDVNYTLVRTDGTTYISTLGGTMQQLASKGMLQDNLHFNFFKLLNPEEGSVQSMVEDNKGMLWIVRESSIDKVDLRKGTVDAYGPNDFDYNMTFTEARPCHNPATDDIIVGTPNGSLTFNPATLTKTNYQPKIIFTAVHYNGEDNILPLLHCPKLVVPATKRNLTISFAALDYTRKYQTRYAYRIKGFTPEGRWIQLGGQNMIGFNRISHGDYVLQVKATNTHGVWGKYIAELPIEVKSTFWESVWGKLLLFILAVTAVGSIIYIYNRRQRESLNHDMSEMKNRFFSHASHKLRTPLSLIGGPVKQVLDNERGLSADSRSLLLIVQRNAAEMLEMLNKMLRFDNNTNLYLDEGGEKAFELTGDSSGNIDDSNAHTYLEEMGRETGDDTNNGDKDITLLVVEDNADLRQFLYTILKPDYNVLLAENGKEGLIKARQQMPDFILTDVTMPVMDGITMVHYIKQDSNTAHIPIIVLSAKASEEDHLKGFEEGIDGYLTKPFSATYLKGRIEAVINQRHALQQDMLKQIQRSENETFQLTHTYPQTARTEEDVEKSVTKTLSINDATTEKIVNFITSNISNPDMKIDDIASAMGMSRSVLYGKIKNAVGMTPVDFVRHIRIMRATELLCQTDDTLSSIAYSVGFSDPKYFSKVFKKEMGIIPSEYRENAR